MSAPTVDWTSFANTYDMFLEYNPAYQEILRDSLAEVGAWRLPPGGWIADLGAGTGNLSLPACRLHPRARVLHLDGDPAMLALARDKWARTRQRHSDAGNLALVRGLAQQAGIRPGSLSGAISVHMLYAVPEPEAVLRALATWLRPGARAVLCDLGRVVDLWDWRLFFLRYLGKRVGLPATARILWQGREIARQNKIIRARQREGVYWTHSLEEFAAAVRRAGLRVVTAKTCNRGYSDFVVAER
ncbi:hypothetical protein AY600_14135 [Phormidium willei BDU 130791]|nr:hypothetical protein AY600_14135 [Phormidium willei BDU 130791]